MLYVRFSMAKAVPDDLVPVDFGGYEIALMAWAAAALLPNPPRPDP
jgi:hypothetical protein